MSSPSSKASKSPSLRRIQADIRELALDPSPQYHAAPLESDMFEWYGLHNILLNGAKFNDSPLTFQALYDSWCPQNRF
jgi:ubiquitin-protein ligase